MKEMRIGFICYFSYLNLKLKTSLYRKIILNSIEEVLFYPVSKLYTITDDTREIRDTKQEP